MSKAFVGSLICYSLATIVIIAFGFIYITRSKFMPYHKEAIGCPWEDLDSRLKAVLLAAMRIIGGSFLATGLAIIVILAIPFYNGQVWASYAIFSVGITLELPTLYATLLVRKKTLASPPIWLLVLTMILFFLGFLISFF